jgi:hypothetical protein
LLGFSSVVYLLINNNNSNTLKIIKMKKTITTLLLIALTAIGANAQNANIADGFGPWWTISFSGGSSHTFGDLKDFAKTGIKGNLSIDYHFTDKIAYRMIEVGSAAFEVEWPEALYQPKKTGNNYSIVNTEGRGKWNVPTIGSGVMWSVVPGGKESRVSIKAHAAAGVAIINSPTGKSVLNYNGDQTDLFNMNAQRKVSFASTAGIRLDLRIGKNMTLFVNPRYTYTSGKVNYSYKDLSYANENGEFNPSVAMRDIKTTEAILNPNFFSINLGVSVKLCCWTVTALDEEERK